MDRRANWPHWLATWAEGMLGKPFAWGVTDCHALALAAFAVIHGVRPPEAPTWASRDEADALIAEGWDPLKALPRLGAVRVEPGFCRPGDVAVEPPKEATGYPGVLVALGMGRFLTGAPGAVVHIVTHDEIDPAATFWRWGSNG